MRQTSLTRESMLGTAKRLESDDLETTLDVAGSEGLTGHWTVMGVSLEGKTPCS